MNLYIKTLGLLIFGLAMATGAPAIAKSSKKVIRKPSSVERPPQFVLLAFDGSKDIAMWDDTMAFANTVKTTSENNAVNNNLLRFTYFVNPTYYTDITYKTNYVTPGLGKSVSCIGWSDTRANIPIRVGRTNKAFTTGHEIGSHANSHCDASGADKDNPLYGHAWTEDNWSSEFDQFNKLLFGTFELNKLGTPTEYPPTGFAFKPSDVVGFRAPLLATTPGLWPTLKKFQFRYDTSQTSSPTYWPQRQVWGGWNFPLASIKIAGTNRTTLSMDYNWLYFHSGGVTKPNLTPEEHDAFKNQMLDSYKYYFKLNYYGGRGPINIGHHFSKWNGGAYWQGMQEFAQFVCAKKEVRCVTYSEYATWLDRVDDNTMKSYRAGDFAKLPDEGIIKDIAVPLMADVRIDSNANGFEAVIESSDINKARLIGATVQLQTNFVPEKSSSITREELIAKVGKGNNVLIRAALVNRKGVVINWATYKVKNLGLPNESMSDQLENHTNDPETSEAHNLHD
jgi:hypothetical protein